MAWDSQSGRGAARVHNRCSDDAFWICLDNLLILSKESAANLLLLGLDKQSDRFDGRLNGDCNNLDASILHRCPSLQTVSVSSFIKEGNVNLAGIPKSLHTLSIRFDLVVFQSQYEEDPPDSDNYKTPEEEEEEERFCLLVVRNPFAMKLLRSRSTLLTAAKSVRTHPPILVRPATFLPARQLSISQGVNYDAFAPEPPSSVSSPTPSTIQDRGMGAAAKLALGRATFTTQSGPKIPLYLTLIGIVCGYLSCFWHYGFTRMGLKMQAFMEGDAASKVKKQTVIDSVTRGVIISLVGMGTTLIGVSALVGSLVAKTLTSSSISPMMASSNPVLALDVFLVQAATNTTLGHFLALLCSLWLLHVVGEGKGIQFKASSSRPAPSTGSPPPGYSTASSTGFSSAPTYDYGILRRPKRDTRPQTNLAPNGEECRIDAVSVATATVSADKDVSFRQNGLTAD
eukprot:gene30906-35959_t